MLAVPRHNLAILLNGGNAGTEAVVEGLKGLDVVVRKLKVEDVEVGLGEVLGWDVQRCMGLKNMHHRRSEPG